MSERTQLVLLALALLLVTLIVVPWVVGLNHGDTCATLHQIGGPTDG